MNNTVQVPVNLHTAPHESQLGSSNTGRAVSSRQKGTFPPYMCQSFSIVNVMCRFLWFPPEQHPIVCQLGGSNPETLAAAVKIVAKYGYDEINLNCGCPSERVAGAGCFGAAMMLQPELVARCCQAMQDAAPHIPVTVKCRLGKLFLP